MSFRTKYELQAYLSKGTRPVSISEFMEFWRSLSNAEKDHFCRVPIK